MSTLLWRGRARPESENGHSVNSRDPTNASYRPVNSRDPTNASYRPLVGLATGLGARYPRFRAENITQVAGSYGGLTFMVGAVLFLVITIALLGWPSSLYLWHRARHAHLTTAEQFLMAASFLAAASLSLATWWLSMRSGVRALQQMDRTPA